MVDKEDLKIEEYEIEYNMEEDEEDSNEEDVFDALENRNVNPYARHVKMILIELAILFFIIGTVSIVRFWLDDPERIAKEYVQCNVRRDWNDLYEYLHFQDENSEFLTKKIFVSAKTLSANNMEIIHSRIKSIQKKPGTSSTYLVEYIKNEEHFTEEVTLIRVNGMWKVDGESKFTESNIQLRVPNGATVYFDDTKIDKKYVQESNDAEDFYVLPKTIEGLHVVKVEKEHRECETRILDFEDGKPVTISMHFCGEFMKEVAKKAQEDVKYIYENAEIGRTCFVSLQLSDVKIRVEEDKENTQLLNVFMTANYEYKYKPTNRYRRVRTEKSSVENQMTYVYQNQKLQLKDVKKVETSFLRKDWGRY